MNCRTAFCRLSCILIVAVTWCDGASVAQQPLAQDTAMPGNHPPIGGAVPLPEITEQQLLRAWSNTFADDVDIDILGTLAVQSDGRIKSFESHASQMMQMLAGPRLIDEQSRIFTYLDLIFRPHRYEDTPIVFVKKKPIRAQIIDALRSDSVSLNTQQFEQELQAFMDTGLISPQLLNRDSIRALRARLSQDLIRTAKPAEQIDNALAVREGRILLGNWRIVSPTHGDTHSRWYNPLEVMTAPIGTAAGEFSEAHHRALDQLWEQFATAWLQEDAQGVNDAAVQLAAFVPTINPGVYPSRKRLAAEAWYFRAPWYFGGSNLTGIWVLYALTMIPLLLAVVFRWRGARRLGMFMFLLAFGMHTFAIMLRWYVAARWPNTNMFEAVTTAAWFGGVFALFLEAVVRKRPMAGLFALGSAAASMVALMCAHYMPLALNANISNKMPVLHDVWLYIHTNVIIFSYALIFMAAISALLYLCRRVLQVLLGQSGSGDYARVGGAGSIIMTGPGAVQLTAEKTNFGQVLDGTTMVLMEMSFVLLWTGLVMGAIWADHSWGRPWGWDPKEVFALNTFIVFAVLIHTRLKVRDKGLWTAILALFGTVVMLFNWIFINFFIVGLHSYA